MSTRAVDMSNFMIQTCLDLGWQNSINNLHSKTAGWNCANTPELPVGTQLKDTSEQFVHLPNPVVKERTVL